MIPLEIGAASSGRGTPDASNMKHSVAAIASLLIGSAAMACQIPVFRFALERWPADPYELAIFHRGELSEAQEELIDEIGIDANVQSVVIDVDSDSPSEFEFYGTAEIGKGDLFGRLFFPPHSGLQAPVWEGPLDAASYGRLVDSP